MNNQNNKNSNKDDLKIKELAIKEDKSKSNSINVTIPNENISPNIIGNLFILNNFWHINNINNSLSNDSQDVSNSTNFKSKLSIDYNDSIINEFPCLKKLNSLRANYYLKYKLYDIIEHCRFIGFNQ